MAADSPAARAEIDEQIRRRYERDRAILISDMSGFSRITQAEGILHFLELIHRMQLLTFPLIEAHGGQLVKAEADNLYAAFDHPQAAVDAAVAMHDACVEHYGAKHDNDRVALSIGIAWGRVLDLDGEDFYGDAVNLASKLGEDIGRGGDLLLTQAAADRIRVPGGWLATARREHISKIDIDLVQLARA